MKLGDFLARTATLAPSRTAAVDARGGRISYWQLLCRAEAFASAFGWYGVGPGTRVGIELNKSIDALAAVYGALFAGAAYVPIDPNAPDARRQAIANGAALSAMVVTSNSAAEPYRNLGCPIFDASRRTLVGARSSVQEPRVSAFRARSRPASDPRVDLAYVLFTSGSTGGPKGVCLSHRNASVFAGWCMDEFQLNSEDRILSPAPLHFDLSTLDVFGGIGAGSTILFAEPGAARNPRGLAKFIADQRVSVLYATPSVLMLLTKYGHLAALPSRTLRAVLFAGEVYPKDQLHTLMDALPNARFFNLYGPTETNVCTYYEIPSLKSDSRDSSYPIGKPCPYCKTSLLREPEFTDSDRSELCVAGDSVMLGYWDRPADTERAFIRDADGTTWYRTGDLVTLDDQGNFLFCGRRDRMVKRRGYRIELDEVEASLNGMQSVIRAGVVSTRNGEGETRIVAFLTFADGLEPSLIQMRKSCAAVMPAWMIPDSFEHCARLPCTASAKLDYQRLQLMAENQ